MSKDAQRAIASLRTLASLLVTSSNFRQLASDAILVSRDILADNTIALADQAKSAAKDVKPTEKERKEGFDFEATQKKGKKVAKGLASGRIQGEIKESIWDEVEDLKDWVEEKLPEGEEAKEKVIAKLQSVSFLFFDHLGLPLTPCRSSSRRSRTQSTSGPSPPSSTSSRSTDRRLKPPSTRPKPTPRFLTRMRRSNKPVGTCEPLSRSSAANRWTASSPPPRRWVQFGQLYS